MATVAARIDDLQNMAYNPQTAGTASVELEVIVRDYPANYYGWVALATAYYTAKNYAQAVPAAWKAQQLDKDGYFAHLLLGNIYCGMAGDLDRQTQQAISGNDPNAAQWMEQRRKAIERSKTELEMAKTITAREGITNKHIFLRLGDLDYLQGQIVSQESMAKYMASHAGETITPELQAEALRSAIDPSSRFYRSAAESYLQAYQIQPVTYYEAFSLGRIYYLLQQYQDARQYLEIASRTTTDPFGGQMPSESLAEVHHTLGLALGHLNDYAGALRYLEMAKQEYAQGQREITQVDAAIQAVRAAMQ
jgi:tetratricopeptide (TPR) repeat protein